MLSLILDIIQYLQELLQITHGTENVTYAMPGPLAVAGIGLGAQLVGKGLSSLFGRKDRRRQRRRENQARMKAEQALSGLQEGIADTRSRGRDALLESQQSNEELYGAETERRSEEIRDTVNQQNATAAQAVSRSLLSGGGDVTGAGGVTLGRLQSQANESVSNALSRLQNEISQRGDNERRFAARRADNLFSTALSGESNVYGALQGQANNAEMLSMQQRQAQRQMGADIGSEISGLVASSLYNQE